MKLLLIVAFLVLCSNQLVSVSAWGYHGNEGPANWYKKYSDCAKRGQSPIEMTEANSVYTDSYKKFAFTNYGTVGSSTDLLLNNGHTAQITIQNAGNMRVTGFGQTFKPWQIHFHWGKTDNEGSEHRTRNSHHHPAEMHFVHVNTKYANTSEAVKNQDGLLVFGTIMEINNTGVNNTFLDKFVKKFGSIKYGAQNVSIPALTLSDAFSVNTAAYYHYNGSLTTPGCNQAVLWVVFKDPIYMSRSQITDFRKLRHETLAKSVNQTEYISNNYRPLQSRNGRNIFRTWQTAAANNINNIPSVTFIMATVAILVKYLM